MICKICNSENPETSKFCAACGAKLEEAAPAAAAPMFCSVCGGALEANTKFCAACGATAGAPAAAEEPVPVMAAAPASEAPAPSAVPTPVNDVPASSAVPTPVNDPAPTGFGNFVAAQTAAPAEFGAGATDIKPDFGKVSSDGPSELPAFEMSDAAAVVAKPAKKGGKKALKIVLITLGALLIVAGVLYALFFREFFHPMFMGNQGYAAKIERSRTDIVMESEALENVTKKSDLFANSVVKNMLQMNSFSGSSSDLSTAFGTGDISSMVKEYYNAFMEAYGVNAVKVELDADIDLSDSALSALDIEMLEAIDFINDSEFTMNYAVSNDAVGGFVEVTDGAGFTVNAKGIVYADGNVALMFPFGSNKCIKMKLDTSTGTVTETEEVDIDPAEVERLTQAIVDIYLKHYEKAEATIENGDIFIGGTADNATLKVSGRLITVNMSQVAIGEMLAEMLTYVAEDQYFTNKIIEMAEESGMELSAVDYKNELIKAADEVKYNVPFGLTVKTVVNFNGDVLGGAYDVTVPNQGGFGVKYIMNGDDCGFAILAMGMEVCSITVDAKNDTDGTIRLESSVLAMGMSMGMTGEAGMQSNVPTGINIDYAGVKNEKFFNTEVPVGTYDIYLAGTAASGPENSAFRIHIEDKVEGDTLKNTFKLEMAEYGSIALNLTSTAYNDTELLTIPSDTYDMGDPNTMTDDQITQAGEYLLSMINEIKGACEGSSSAIAQALAPELENLAASLESALTPMADYSDIQWLAGETYNMMFVIMDKYEEGGEYISDDLADEMGELYSDLEDMYDELYYASEMTLDEYTAYQNKYESYRINWNGLERKADKEIEEGRNSSSHSGTVNASIAGTWTCKEYDIYGITVSAEDLGIENHSMNLYDDGSATFVYGDSITYGEWYIENGNVVVKEITDYGEYVNEFEYDGQYLSFTEDDMTIRFAK